MKSKHKRHVQSISSISVLIRTTVVEQTRPSGSTIIIIVCYQLNPISDENTCELSDWRQTVRCCSALFVLKTIKHVKTTKPPWGDSQLDVLEIVEWPKVFPNETKYFTALENFWSERLWMKLLPASHEPAPSSTFHKRAMEKNFSSLFIHSFIRIISPFHGET